MATETPGSSDGSGILGPGDSFTLTEKLVSAEVQTLTHVSGALTSPDGSAVINQAASAYPDLQFGVPSANSAPFALTIPASAQCGINLPLGLQISTDQGNQGVAFKVATGVAGPYHSYTSAQVPLAIPDNQPTGAVSTLNVPQAGRVKGLRVQIGRITHPYDGDLRVTLTSPTGTTVTLINPNRANNGQNFLNTVFDQSAPTSITAGTAPYTGTFRPEGDLSAFNGEQQQGAWQLKVTDTSPGDVGTLEAWGASSAPAVCTSNPLSSIAANPSPAPPGSMVTFDGSGSVSPSPGTMISSYRWDFGDPGSGSSNTATGVTAGHAYAARGQYTVTLTVTDSSGKTGQSSMPLSVTQTPVAAMSVTPTAPVAASSVTFDASASTHDPAGSIVDYRWDLDGSGNYATDTGTTPRATTTYPTSRTVPVHVRVTDDTGATATTGQAVTIANAPPTASFAVGAPVLVGQPTTLDAGASRDPDGSIINYTWDLAGTGAFGTDAGNNPRLTTTFGSPGLVNVGLRVTDNEGATASTSRAIQVTRPPVARLAAAPNPGAIGAPVTLDAGSSSDPDGAIVAYRWDLDGSGAYATSTGATPFLIHSFPAAGTYPVSVRVTDNYGASANTTISVTVSASSAGATGAPSAGVPAVSAPSISPGATGDPEAGIASLSKADLATIIPGSDRYFAALTGLPLRRAKTVAGRGLWVNVLADRPARFALTVVVSAGDAQRLGLARAHRADARLARRRRSRTPSLVKLGGASTSLRAAGQRPLRIALSPRARRALRRIKSRVTLLVTGSATDAAGHRTRLARAFAVRR